MKQSMNVILTGVGGQGNVLAARLLATAAMHSDYLASVGDVYGLSQRGGTVASHVRWDREKQLPPLVPKGALDLLVAFDPLEALRLQTLYGWTGTTIVVNDHPVMPIGVQAGRLQYPDQGKLADILGGLCRQIIWVPGTRTALELGNIQMLNTLMLGVLASNSLIDLQTECLESVIRAELPEKIVPLNLEAFRKGTTLVHGH